MGLDHFGLRVGEARFGGDPTQPETHRAIAVTTIQRALRITVVPPDNLAVRHPAIEAGDASKWGILIRAGGTAMCPAVTYTTPLAAVPEASYNWRAPRR
jgi:hypothetical protein